MSAVERRVATAAERVARGVAEAIPGVQAEAQRGRVVVTGRGLTRRLSEDARLRWIGGAGAMTAAEALKPALLAALSGIEGVNGVWDGVPVRATVPYLILGELAAVDWGTKDAAGRELRVAVTVRDADDDAARVTALAGAVEAAVSGLPRDLAGWRVASVVLVRSRVVSEGAGRWAAMVDHRVRMLAG